ncbi:hypothetical protein [Cytobacillus sp.]|uniref:hypothetical protein n=1 Tax=Cytobacillus sp. TaxID=2675269 RepID=UPI0028BDCB0E|nr:hypothetical protein [Cytobacillus sp.]
MSDINRFKHLRNKKGLSITKIKESLGMNGSAKKKATNLYGSCLFVTGINVYNECEYLQSICGAKSRCLTILKLHLQ